MPRDSETTTDWPERRGLLAGLEGEQRRAREDLLLRLREEGCSIEDLEAAAAEGRLPLLAVERVFSKELRYAMSEVLEQTGLSEEFMRRNFLALNLSYPDPNELAYADSELEAMHMLKALVDSISEERVLELSRIVGRAALQVSQAGLDAFFQSVGDLPEADLALRLADLATAIAPTIGPLLETPIRFHVRELTRREAIDYAERAEGPLAAGREIAVAFADIVSFTQFSEHQPEQRIGELVARLEVLASDVSEQPVRLIKLLGDAAMLTSSAPEPLVQAADRLIWAVERDPSVPDLRVGVASGRALNRGGDWYGRPVNLASRITAGAAPGTLVATEAVASATAARYEWAELPPQRLKGIEGEQQLFELVRSG